MKAEAKKQIAIALSLFGLVTVSALAARAADSTDPAQIAMSSAPFDVSGDGRLVTVTMLPVKVASSLVAVTTTYSATFRFTMDSNSCSATPAGTACTELPSYSRSVGISQDSPVESHIVFLDDKGNPKPESSEKYYLQTERVAQLPAPDRHKIWLAVKDQKGVRKAEMHAILNF